jgi:hypothetical protein
VTVPRSGREECIHVVRRMGRTGLGRCSEEIVRAGAPAGFLLSTALGFSGIAAPMIVLMTWPTSALTSTYLAGTSGACTCSRKPPLNPSDVFVAFGPSGEFEPFCLMA